MSKTSRFVVASVLLAVSIGRIPTAAAGDLRLEAEAMSLPSGGGKTFADGSASGGRALVLHSNAKATSQITTPATTGLVVRARGDACKGAPKMSVRIDGAALATVAVSNTTWASYSFTKVLSSGAHWVSVVFTNDHRTSGCDRNLRIDYIDLKAVPEIVPTLFVDADSQAQHQADAWRTTRPADSALIDRIANQAQGFWFGEWSGNVQAAVDAVVDEATASSAVPVLVPYNIPARDCGGYSSGGTSVDAYRSWIRAFASGIGRRKAIVVLEPDALAAMDCLSDTARATRLELLRDAVSVLKAGGATKVYIDAGHSRWHTAAETTARLKSAGIGSADGFSLNVSNFNATADEVAYGNAVSSQAGGKHFVVDTSRNGLGSNGEWCNAPGRALGAKPTLLSSGALDGYLWIKRPGESDGTCNGGPAAGAFWADYALGLAQRAAW